MTIGEAILLGVVQGVTEFIPISSKTHLVVVPALLGSPTPDLPFIVFLHLGTLLALLAYFARDLWRMAADLGRTGSEGRRMVALLAVASVPAAVFGLVFERTFERLLSRPAPAAFALLATAAILLAAEWISGAFGRRNPAKPLRQVPLFRDAAGVGVAQAVALLPGVSRSGSTMAAGLGLGLAREAAARFSFLLAIPAIAGANILELPEAIDAGLGTAEIAGFAAAVLSGYVAVATLLRWLRTRTFLPFAVYCAAAGISAGVALS